ncbi:MAG: bi-domain-containing oxidoreductase [Thalassospira sp.]|uniref:bi-domain-containing oxidoreductase n=1 Tax=Thalassospira sp. TaxID=1912094 RepID=UPI001B021087|nr:bi-domain-containing oxidoreductase [Thalassospira sp.]MBO6819636.1 bi-domain-containing oxidoreductase [Thalassospira sp.]MBO6889473.1 bi-domain-containing oxidoreductase [Thalassospira sp.]
MLRSPGERKLALANCPIPAPGKNAVLVKTAYSVISPGTEFTQADQARASLLQKAWQRPDLVVLTVNHLKSEGLGRTRARVENRLGRPMPMGYCAVGRVEATGENVTDLRAGQRVAIAGMGQANHAEWNQVSVNLACPVPDAVPDRKAVFATLYALALHALRQGETSIGDQIAVIGAGLIGQLVAETARAAGALVTVIEPDLARRKIATGESRAAGFTKASDAPQSRFDSVFICAPGKGNHRLIDDAARLCRDRGTIICVGDVTPNGRRKALYEKEITIRQVRSYGPGRYDPNYEGRGEDYPLGHVRWTIKRNMQAALDLMADGRLDPTPLITSEIDFADIPDHFAKGPDPAQLATLVRYRNAETAPFEPLAPSVRTSVLTHDRLRVGLIGAGNYLGGGLLPLLQKHPDIKITACCSQSGLAAVALSKKIDGLRMKGGADELLEDQSINSVIITTRHDSHAELAAASILAGKNVWLEKPIAIDRAGLDLLREVADRMPRHIFMVGHNRRYAPMAAKLREVLPTDVKQFHYRVRITPLPGDHWLHHSDQGGRTIGEISHFIDLIKSLVDSELVELNCHWIDRRAGDSIWQLRFADGSMGEVSYLHGSRGEPKEVLEVTAPNFSASLFDWKKLRVNRRIVTRNWFGQDKGKAAAIKAFAGAVTSGKHPALMPSIEHEIDLMARILTAANTTTAQPPN